MDVNDLYQIKNGHTGKVVAEGLASNFAALAKELNANSTTAAIKSLKGYGKQDVPLGVSILTTDGDFILPAEWGTLGSGKTVDGIMVSDGTHFTVFNTTIGENLAFGSINNDIGGIPNITYPAIARLDFDGKAHSAALTDANPAYAYCIGLGPDYYLPAAGQLYDAMQGSVEFNKALEALGLPLLANEDTFWSSTEIDLDKAWAVGYPIGTTVSADKTIQYKVMAVKDYVAPEDQLLSEDNTLNEALHILSTNTQENTERIDTIKIKKSIKTPGEVGLITIGEITNAGGANYIVSITYNYTENNRVYEDNVIVMISGSKPENQSINFIKLAGYSNKLINGIGVYYSVTSYDQKIYLKSISNNIYYINLECIPISGNANFIFYDNAIYNSTIPSGYNSYIIDTSKNGMISTAGINASSFNSMNINDFLYRNRSNSFTPTKDYEPATKKYVDDQHSVVTQEEYDALGEVVNTDNKIYFITEP